MKRYYNSAFGRFEVPLDVYLRSLRLMPLRPNYLEEWCRWQYVKTAR